MSDSATKTALTDWQKRDKAAVWHPFTQMLTAEPSVTVVRGEGAELITEDGRRILDAISSWWVTTYGHAHPYIAEKVAEQLKTLEHSIFAGFSHPPAITLAERLLERLSDNQKRIFYSDNGSTAVEVGLKMALQYWYNQGEDRTGMIALKGSYHGDTFGAMSVSGRSYFNQPFERLMFDVDYVDVPVPGKEQAALDQLDALLAKKKYSSFIFEPLVQGAGGMVMYSPQVLDEMIRKVRKHGVLVHADEVMTGFGRTGSFFATDQCEEQPDIFSLSKGLTAGTMALGVTSCTDEIYNAFLSEDKMKTFFHGHSFTANPVACSAALASLDLFDQDELKSIDRIAEQHRLFGESIRSHTALLEVRQTGTIIALELATGEATSYFNNMREKIYAWFLDRDLLMRPLGNVIYILPPYCITNDQLKRIYNEIKELLDIVGGHK